MEEPTSEDAQQPPTVRIRDIGVVISGAGARGAYEAGLLAYLMPEIAARTREQGLLPRFSFLGTSAGALNSVLIASRAPDIGPDDSTSTVRAQWTKTMAEVTKIWRGIRERQVLSPLPMGRLAGALSRLVPVVHLPFLSTLNDDPLASLAADPSVVNWEAMHQRVAGGFVPAIGAAATARDGRTVVFLDRQDRTKPLLRDEDRDIDYVDVEGDVGLRAEHVLASSSIPSVFAARRINQPREWAGWYYDGGVRLNTPLKPALVLGLNYLLIVGTHPDTYKRDSRPDPDLPAPEIDEALIPVAEQLMVDQLIQDLHNLRTVNALRSAGQIRYIYAGPPDLDTLAGLSRYAPSQASMIRLLRQLLYGRARWELSSYLLFDRGYLSAAVDAGMEQAAGLNLDAVLGGALGSGIVDGFWRT